jgi:hypothetical protein
MSNSQIRLIRLKETAGVEARDGRMVEVNRMMVLRNGPVRLRAVIGTMGNAGEVAMLVEKNQAGAVVEGNISGCERLR